MKKIFVMLTALIVVSTASPVVAQETTGNDDSTGLPSDCDERIDANTFLCSASTDGDTATLELYSTRNQLVTLTDAGGFMEAGEVNQDRGVRLRSDRRTTRTMAVTESNGYVGVSVATDSVLYAVPIEDQQAGFVPGSPSSDDVFIAGSTVFVLFAVALPASYVAIKRYKGGEHDEL